jgi:nitrogen fixation protein
MRAAASLFALLSLGASVAACSRVEVIRLSSAADATTKGLRFNRPSPYLLTVETKDGCAHSIVYLPDPEEVYAIQVHSALGSVDAKVTLENGWNVTTFGQTTDSKIPETITAVTGLLTAATKSAAPGTGAPPTPCTPGLRKITYHPDAKQWKVKN